MNVYKLNRVAGEVHAECTCCAERQALVGDQVRTCPISGRTYADRGDGLFELEPESALLSDRPSRTGAKTRINLERATFAGGRR